MWQTLIKNHHFLLVQKSTYTVFLLETTLPLLVLLLKLSTLLRQFLHLHLSGPTGHSLQNGIMEEHILGLCRETNTGMQSYKQKTAYLCTQIYTPNLLEQI